MEIRALAEQILRSPKLEDKLACPPSLSDAHRGPQWEGPIWPARPERLRLDLPRDKSPFPGLGQLDDDRARGQVLHFFANHELLAMELMALALVRFPDAPAAFRRGIVHTLREEQDHLRRYLARMTELGVEFGELHNSPFFWTTLRPMSHPIHYCSGLSLCFEQANLDFCLRFGQAFTQVGDTQSAQMMEKVRADEIGHVRHGLHWYRKWKDQRLDDWSAFEAALLEPLTPARAKGKPFDLDGRKKAGFDTDWIERLQVYGRTKGRPPTLWWFNPGCEASLLGGGPSKAVKALRRDLACLPMFLSRRDDAVLAEQAPSPGWLRQWQDLGVPLPEWVPNPQSLQGRGLGEFRPFGPSPEAQAIRPELSWSLEPYRKSADLELRALAHRVAREQIGQGQGDLVGGGVETGWVARSLSEVEELRSRLPRTPLLIKQDLASSGQGQRRLGADEALPTAWVERSLKAHGAVVVEPLLPRLSDVSALYKGTRLLGLSRPLVDAQGTWRGQVLSEPWGALPGPIRRLLSQDKATLRLYRALGEQAPHQGLWNIDGLVYEGAQGPRLFPVVERNPRMTMGHIARGIARWVRHGRPAIWTLHHRRQVGEIAEFAERLRAEHPRQVEQGKLSGGVAFTNDPSTAQALLSVVWVGEPACEGAQALGIPWRL
ncbi:MAG: DUF455 family protein [Myxococcota bacterium]|nr:DUF455 family protein [Myxococcota bacterium]